jgi:peptide/nickel transport system permease protein
MTLFGFLVRRMLVLLLVVVAVSSILFALIRLSGDPISILAPPEASREALEQLRSHLGLDDPILIQYGRFVRDSLRFDFGVSFRFARPALEIVLERLPATLVLSATSMLITLGIAFPLGILSALRRGNVLVHGSMTATFVLQSMPAFWLGILLIFLFSVELHVLPSFGYGRLRHLVLPSVTLAGFMLAKTSRFVSASLLQVLGTQYVQVARAKGLNERGVVLKHALKNALIPVITVLGLDVAGLVGGAVVTETIFAWPGLGRLLVQSASGRDYPVVQASVFLVTIMVVTVNFAVEVAYRFLDPRITWD